MLVLSPKLLNCITFLLFLNFHWLKINERIQYKVLSLIKLFTLVILHIFILFLVLNAIVLHTRLRWSHLIVLLIIPVSKSQIDVFIIPLLLCGTVLIPRDLRHFSSHSTSSEPNLNSPLFSLSPSVFLKKLKTHLCLFSFPP